MRLFGSYIRELRDVFLTDHEYQIIKPFEGTVWRGISRVPDLERAKQLYKPGKDFLWTAFTSTTTDKSVAMRWGQIVFEILVDPPDGMYDDEVWEFAPADIKEFSAYRNESEVLFPPNVKFRVIEVGEEQGKPLVKCIATALDGVGGQVEFDCDTPCLVQDPVHATVLVEPLLKQLVEMGHPENRARRALREASNDLEAAKAWLEKHRDDPDADAPLDAGGTDGKAVLQRVRTRPKVGSFVSDKGDVGRLCVQKGRCGKRKAFIFTVTELASPEDRDAEDYWVARLVHKGQDRRGRDVWSLDGHPQGGTFVSNAGHFLECEDDGVKQRQVWTYHPAGVEPLRQASTRDLEALSPTPSTSPSQAMQRLRRATTHAFDTGER